MTRLARRGGVAAITDGAFRDTPDLSGDRRSPIYARGQCAATRLSKFHVADLQRADRLRRCGGLSGRHPRRRTANWSSSFLAVSRSRCRSRASDREELEACDLPTGGRGRAAVRSVPAERGDRRRIRGMASQAGRVAAVSKREEMESVIRRYFEGCNEGSVGKIASCFVPDAVHYFPPGMYGGAVDRRQRHRREMVGGCQPGRLAVGSGARRHRCRHEHRGCRMDALQDA